MTTKLHPTLVPWVAAYKSIAAMYNESGAMTKISYSYDNERNTLLYVEFADRAQAAVSLAVLKSLGLAQPIHVAERLYWFPGCIMPKGKGHLWDQLHVFFGGTPQGASSEELFWRAVKHYRI